MDTELPDALRKARSRIVEQGARILKGMTDSGYAQWTLKELRSACEEGFDAYLDFIETRKKERLDSFIRQTAGKRGGPGFHLGDVVRAFMSFLPAALAELGEEGQAEFGKALYEPVEYAVATLADTYLQAKENEMFTTIRQLTAAVAGKVGELQAVADAVLESGTRLTDNQYGYLALLDARGRQVKWAVTGLRPEECVFSGKAGGHNIHAGLFAEIIKERTPVLRNDLTAGQGRAKAPGGHPEIGSFLGVPILSGRTVLGLIAVANKPGGYGEEDENVLSTFANLAAPALKAAQVIERLSPSRQPLEKRNQELQALNLALGNVVEQLGLETTLKEICLQVVENFGLKAAWIGLVNEETHDIEPRQSCGFEEEELWQIKSRWDDFPLGMGPPEVAIKTRKAAVYNTIPSSPEFQAWQKEARKMGYRSSAALALICEGEPLAALSVYSDKEDFFDEDVLRVLQTFTNQAAVLARNARLFDTAMEKWNDVQTALERLEVTQEHLLQSAKMSEVGEIVSGIAHELNNPLTGAIGFTHLLLGQDLTSKGRQLAEQAFREIQRTSRIVNNLLGFARDHAPEVTPTQMSQVVESAIELREYDLKVNNIGIETDFERKLPLTMADSHALQQVFVNLIINAEQAIKGAQRGGTITIKTERENGTIRVSVSDDGPGIPEGELGLIFEPFYTSKPPGQGTGLGLAVSRKIVQGHGGEIRAASKEGKGTTFIIELPVVAPEKAEEVPRPAVRETPPAKSRILVVDDELPVQELMCGVLEAEGHEVHLASNGEAALACLGAYEYDLVISDIRMPQLDGEELYAQICSNWPHLADRVILSTGDVVTDKTRAFLEKADLPRITKPFDINRLRQVVRGALGQRAGSTRVPGNAAGPKE